MANTKQAKKRAVQNLRRRARNKGVRTGVRTVIRKFRATLQSEPAKAAEMAAGVSSALDVAVRKGVLHPNTAARLKSRAARATARATAGSSG